MTTPSKQIQIQKMYRSLLLIFISIELKEVDNFKYLGSVLTRDGYCTREIKMRIAITKEAFKRKRHFKIKRELTNARVKKYREKKCTESQQFLRCRMTLPRKCKTSKLNKILQSIWQSNFREGFVRRKVLMS